MDHSLEFVSIFKLSGKTRGKGGVLNSAIALLRDMEGQHI